MQNTTQALMLAGLGLAITGLQPTSVAADDFTVSIMGHEAAGFAQETEFSQTEIMSALGALCPNGTVTDFTSETTADGVRFFGAECAGGYKIASGTVYVNRTSNGALALDMP